MFAGGLLDQPVCPSICSFVHVSIHPSLYKILVNLCHELLFAAIVVKLCRYIDHVMKLCKMQFSTINSLWFKDFLPLNLENFV